MKELTLLPSMLNPRSVKGQCSMHQRESTRGFEIKTNFEQAQAGVFVFLTNQLTAVQNDVTSLSHISQSIEQLTGLGENPEGFKMDNARLELEIPYDFDPLQELLDAKFMQVRLAPVTATIDSIGMPLGAMHLQPVT
jgi:hypothetical protein